jgi:hypothetical protein
MGNILMKVRHLKFKSGLYFDVFFSVTNKFVKNSNGIGLDVISIDIQRGEN